MKLPRCSRIDAWLLSAAILVGGCAGTREPADSGLAGGAGASGSGSSGGGGSTGTHPLGGGGSNGSGGGASSGGGGAGLSSDANCGLRTFGLNKLPPDMLIVLDRSGSMVNQATGGSCGVTRTCGTRWVEMTNAINQVVAQTQTTIRWGLKFFADVPACEINDGATVPVDANAAPAIAAAIMNMKTGGQTPTRAAMVSAGAYLGALTDPNPKFILLATDGEPNCQEGNAKQDAPDTDAAVASVKAAAGQGFPVYVIGVATSGDVLDMTLREMAKAGGRPRTEDPEYYPVSSSEDLVAALGKIGGQITSCVFGLGAAPPDPTNIAVDADGMRVPKDPNHKEGWDYGTGMTSVQLFGSWCEKVKANQVTNVQAIFGCPGFIIP
ncbi:MAG TPA: vWA domain-containing protein [Polyangia bacterium]|nr:vWA domain-containing protein [Polyangia bacterium]